MLINILSTVDNELNTMVVKQVSSLPSHTVEKHSSDDSPIVEQTPSPTAEEPLVMTLIQLKKLPVLQLNNNVVMALIQSVLLVRRGRENILMLQ